MEKKYYCKTADDVIACRKKYFPEDLWRCNDWKDWSDFRDAINKKWAIVKEWESICCIAHWHTLDWTEILFNNLQYDL